MVPRPPQFTLFPYTTLFRSWHPESPGGRSASRTAAVQCPPTLDCRLAASPARRAIQGGRTLDRKSTRLNSSHGYISYAVFCLKKKKNSKRHIPSLPREREWS